MSRLTRVGFLIIAPMCLVWGLTSLYRFLRFTRFPQTDGRITSTGISLETSQHSYSEELSYSYSVHGSDFSSSRVYSICSLGHSSPESAKRSIERLATAPSLIVRYDPSKPSFSFLRNGPMIAIILPLLLGAFFTVYAILSP